MIKKVRFYIANIYIYIIYNYIYIKCYIYTILPGLFNIHHLNFTGNHPALLQLMRDGCLFKFPPLSIARYLKNYLFIQLSELEQCKVKKLPNVSRAAHDLYPGSLSREFEVLPLNHSTLLARVRCVEYSIRR